MVDKRKGGKMEKENKEKTGTKEWAEHSKNIQIGCENGCTYCYAREMAVRRKLVKDNDEWVNNPRRNKYSQVEMKKNKFEKLDGRIMFPTTHDITDDNVDDCVEYLKGWLREGNEVLIVSKPKLSVILKMIKELDKYKDQITFRFTIGSNIDKVLKFWEPNAVGYGQRLASLMACYYDGWETSVSIEPALHPGLGKLIDDIYPYVTDTIWVGFMNGKDSRLDVPEDREHLLDHYMELLDAVESVIGDLHEYVKREGLVKIRWKDSVRKKLGLDEYEGVM